MPLLASVVQQCKSDEFDNGRRTSLIEVRNYESMNTGIADLLLLFVEPCVCLCELTPIFLLMWTSADFSIIYV